MFARDPRISSDNAMDIGQWLRDARRLRRDGRDLRCFTLLLGDARRLAALGNVCGGGGVTSERRISSVGGTARAFAKGSKVGWLRASDSP